MTRDELEREMADVRYGRSQGGATREVAVTGEKVIDLDAIRRRHAARVTYREESHTSAPPAEKDAADLLVLLDEALVAGRALDAAWTRYVRARRDPHFTGRVYKTWEEVEAAKARLARFPTPSPTEEEKT